VASASQVVARLKSLGDAEDLKGMARFGMSVEKRFGVSVPAMRKMAKEIGRDHALALKLWKTGIADARILASMIAEPEAMRAGDLNDWVSGIDSWDVCDQVCMNLFEKVPLARRKIPEWAAREEEFVRRSAFALIACLAWHDKEARDAEFRGYLPLIKRGAEDERNFVKKAVSWALRNIGKRNSALHKAAIQTARILQRADSRAARWIAADALRDLEAAQARGRVRG
jgi:3-methyladenine DNA glycosylase AlkD